MFLDNIDANIPPKRQGECLFEIIRFINKYFEFYHVHIILTTNSPIVLSDIPYGNVIDLDGENSDGNDTECKFNTFAANIYSIYHYAYHARTNLLLGGISYRIIKILLEYFINRKIDSRANHILEHKNDIIETIGDPIIRNQLKRLFSLENYKNL